MDKFFEKYSSCILQKYLICTKDLAKDTFYVLVNI